MKRIAFLLILINSFIMTFGQKPFGHKPLYTNRFYTITEIKRYLAYSVDELDPLEGEYDVQLSGDYITPLGNKELQPISFKIWIVCNNNIFSIYSNEEKDKVKPYNTVQISPIGETNAYTFSIGPTSTRIFLQDLNRFNATLLLDNSYARLLTGNLRLDASISIKITYDCIKEYPTNTMYTDALKSKAEETQKPTLWTGTGFALNNNYIVTNQHVVQDAKSIYIQGINGDFINKYRATVVGSDNQNDLAILKLIGVNIKTQNIPYSVKTQSSDVGEEIFVLGYPLTSTMGEEIKLTTGVISSKTGFQGDVSQYQISAPVQPGNSGGPLFDSKGNIIGIVSAKHQGAENVGYAVKTSYLRNLQESVLTANILTSSNNLSTLNLSEKVKRIKNFIYFITCSSLASSDKSYSSELLETKPNNYDKNSNGSNASDKRLTIKSVKHTNTYTSIQFTSNNFFNDTTVYEWCSIDKSSYIVANGKHYKMTKAIGINISPQKTYYPEDGNITFTLYFPPIPKNTKTIDFIEDEESDWNIYGISVK